MTPEERARKFTEEWDLRFYPDDEGDHIAGLTAGIADAIRAAVRAERETVARLLDVLHTIISIGCDYDNAKTADELKKVIDDLVEIASRAHSGESIYEET